MIEIVDLREAHGHSEILAAWDRRLAASRHPNALVSSPTWAAHLAARGNAVRVLVARDPSRGITGIVPVFPLRYALGTATGPGRWASPHVNVTVVAGSALLGPEDPATMKDVIASALAAFPERDAVLFDGLPAESPYWTLGSPPYFSYSPSGIRRAHLVAVEGTFDAYRRTLTPKTRYNIERRIRRLAETGRGALSLERHRSPDDVDRFLAAAEHVRRRSWQHATVGAVASDPRTTRSSLRDLAERGLFRSYVLSAGGAPCAFVIGLSQQGIYAYQAVGYDRAIARHSPGTALIYRSLEDLFTVDPPRLVSFGSGDQDYKRRLGNLEMPEGVLLVLRSTRKNRLRVGFHRLMRRGSTLVTAAAPRSPSG